MEKELWEKYIEEKKEFKEKEEYLNYSTNPFYPGLLNPNELYVNHFFIPKNLKLKIEEKKEPWGSWHKEHFVIE